VRIIGGKHKGRTIHVDKGLDLRPTTDFAKEGLFNILSNKIDFEDLNVLDLFSGTGNIAFEFSSRGANVTSVDKQYDCVRFISKTSKDLGLSVNTMKSDVFKFLKTHSHAYDLIFADPPFDLENIPDIYELVMQNKLVKAGGWLIIEHGSKTDLSQLPDFFEQRKYGNVNFSFFSFGS
jgi:16S rRNA (guanine966-N2)-methyltransferase